jgi:bacterioferritin
MSWGNLGGTRGPARGESLSVVKGKAKLSLYKGPIKDAVAAELLQHATDELTHADQVAVRIIQLGGKPITEPKKWYEWSGCGYNPPNDEYVKTILNQNIDGERCAISYYNDLMKKTKDTDMITYNMVLTILNQEVEHEEDLQALLEDLELMVKRT